MSKLFLDCEELYELTGRETRPAQIKQLRYMGIDHKVRADGSVAVHKGHVDKVFGVIAERPRKIKNSEPNWDAVC